MVVSDKERNFSNYTYKIEIGSGLIIDRTFSLNSGENVTIHVSLATATSDNLKDINIHSIQRAIEILRAYLPDQS